ncbi:hypothetical protein [Planctellipticum variicoloris]|uniref:hypothetical protein n=1 Tax=Planctellipticum variicoloris TaxID=3064265 RepID=UPI003013B2BC|nr:hypothetical protein SH412_002233 [Planctomycetaceae bacterium SH412]
MSLDGKPESVRSGEQVTAGTGRAFEFALEEPGVYRLELWLYVAGAERIWVLGNPWFVGQ